MKILVTWDKYGYSQMADASNCHTEKDEQILAAGMMNYWWEEGGLENLPGSYEIVTSEKRLKAIEINDCALAFINGNSHCQCGHEECSHFQDEMERK